MISYIIYIVIVQSDLMIGNVEYERECIENGSALDVGVHWKRNGIE